MRRHRLITEEEVDDFQSLYDRGCTMTRIASICDCDYSTVNRYLHRRGVAIRSFSEAVTLKFNPIYNEKLGYVLGVLFGDGSVSGSVAELCVKDYDFAEAFANTISEVLNKRPVCKISKSKDGYYYVSVHRRKFAEWFKALTYGSLEDILFGNKEMARGFLRGFFDSEGTYDGVQLKVDNKDPNLIILVVNLLDIYFGIEASIHQYYTKSQWNPKGYWVFRAYLPKRYHSLFLKEVGFSIKRKQLGGVCCA